MCLTLFYYIQWTCTSTQCLFIWPFWSDWTSYQSRCLHCISQFFIAFFSHFHIPFSFFLFSFPAWSKCECNGSLAVYSTTWSFIKSQVSFTAQCDVHVPWPPNLRDQFENHFEMRMLKMRMLSPDWLKYTNFDIGFVFVWIVISSSLSKWPQLQ